jgi:hypothetical protein
MNSIIEDNDAFHKAASNLAAAILKQKPHVKSSVLCSDIVGLLEHILRLQLNDVIDEDCKQRLDMIPTVPLSEGTQGLLSTIAMLIQNKKKKAIHITNTGTSSTIPGIPYTSSELLSSIHPQTFNHSNHFNTTTSTHTTSSHQNKRKQPSSPNPIKQRSSNDHRKNNISSFVAVTSPSISTSSIQSDRINNDSHVSSSINPTKLNSGDVSTKPPCSLILTNIVTQFIDACTNKHNVNAIGEFFTDGIQMWKRVAKEPLKQQRNMLEHQFADTFRCILNDVLPSDTAGIHEAAIQCAKQCMTQLFIYAALSDTNIYHKISDTMVKNNSNNSY